MRGKTVKLSVKQVRRTGAATSVRGHASPAAARDLVGLATTNVPYPSAAALLGITIFYFFIWPNEFLRDFRAFFTKFLNFFSKKIRIIFFFLDLNIKSIILEGINLGGYPTRDYMSMFAYHVKTAIDYKHASRDSYMIKK